MKHIAKLSIATSVLFSGILFMTAASADTPAAKSDVKQCIHLSWLDQSEVVDDQTILFHMKGGKIYENKLPYRCFGLKFEGGFSFATSLHQLCNTDIIRVLHQGTACGLGNFTPYEKPKTNIEKDKTPAGDAAKK
jgi:hypothetical protein